MSTSNEAATFDGITDDTGMLAGIGIRKGQKFDPSPEVVKILERAAIALNRFKSS